MGENKILVDLGLYEEGAMIIAIPLMDGSGFGSYMMGTYEIQKADATFDFSKCDNDGDGEVEFVYCIYAGYSESYGADENTIWPHQWELRAESGSIKVDGVLLDGFASDKYEYTYTMANMTRTMPNVEVVGANYNQTISYAFNGNSQFLITVKAENGEEKVYVISLVESKDDVVTLANV